MISWENILTIFELGDQCSVWERREIGVGIEKHRSCQVAGGNAPKERLHLMNLF